MRLQLDGPDLEELLVRARHEYGSDVRIVKADKVRTGGVGGFFARELFELSIEVDETPAEVRPDVEPRRTPVASRPDVEPRRTPVASRPDVEPRRSPVASRPDVEPRRSEPRGFEPRNSEPRNSEPPAASILDLADAISDREVDSVTTAPRAKIMSPDESPDFTPGIAPFTSQGPALSTDGASFASILAGLTQTVAEQPASAKKSEATTDDADGAFVVRDTRVETAASRPTFVDPQPRPAEAPRERAVSRRPRGTLVRPLAMRDLQDLGLPRELLPPRQDGDLLAVLVGALRSLPPAPEPPRGPGEIFAIVGEGESAWDAGARLARSLELDERNMVYLTNGAAPTKVAPSRRITALEQLPARIDRWRKRSTPTVAVIDAPMNLKATRWNRQALTALSAEAVWLVVSATRKTDDVARWAERLGHTDGIVVTDVDASADPASVLRLGLPVAWLDGRAATPGAWAGLIVDRLVEAR